MDNNGHGGLEIEKLMNKEIIDFSTNINPLKFKGIKKILLKNVKSVFYYPYLRSINENLREKLANYLKNFEINKENIIIGNGTSELIYLIVNTFNPKTALIPVPTFSVYERSLKTKNTKIKFLNLKQPNFKLYSKELKNINKDIIFLCNPNNPTGNFLLDNKEICEISKNFSLVVVDESFIEFSNDKKSAINNINKSENIIVLRSFSKFFGLPGLRIGYAISNEKIIEKLISNINPWNINSFAYIITSEILNKPYEIEKFKKKTHSFIEKEKKFIENSLKKVKGVKVYDSVTNFLLIKVPIDSSLLTKKLFEKGIFVRDCNNFRNLGNNYIRICINSHKENKKFVDEVVKMFSNF